MAGRNGTPSYELLLIPEPLSPSARIQSFNFNGGEEIVVPVDYEEFTSITLVARDSSGDASVLRPFTVGEGSSNSCLPLPWNQPVFQFYLSTSAPTAGIPVRIWWDAQNTFGDPSFFGFIPAPADDALPDLFDLFQGHSRAGVYFDLLMRNITDIPGQGRGYDWIPSTEPDSDVVLVGSDSRGVAAGMVLKTHVQSGAHICVFPMNGQYQLIQRIILYIVLLVAMLMRNQSAVLTVIIGVAMTCVSTTAFHAMGLTRSGTFDLDVLGVFQILGATCCSVTALVVSLRENANMQSLNLPDGAAPHLSRRPTIFFLVTGGTFDRAAPGLGKMKSPKQRAILALFSLWALTTFIGLVCAVDILQLFPAHGYVPACSPSNITVTTTTLTLPVDPVLCATYCATVSSLFRTPGVAIMRPAADIAHIRKYALAMSAVGIPLYVLMFCWVLAVLFRGVNTRYVNGVSRAMLGLGMLACLAAVVSGEILLNGKWLPAGEAPRAVGQWAPIVSVVLAILWKCLLKGLCYLFGRSSAQGFADL
ncbi:hypothetical protein DFH08DRAFT_1083490 [Mycena albidolilacea]|uniref:Uncharacterized protein n=1 Tax=Mycena albidolilacea TaxID=1033008 RepID=A0AAD6ZPV1_9AGAR|nr:hypothetical protein DFH08DRAFT_1083490 [Mycena albidolilacea]